MHTVEELGSKIREEREASGLTQKQLAEKLDINLNLISPIERGTYSKSIGSVHRAIATHFGIKIDEDVEKPEEEAQAPSNGAHEPESHKPVPTVLFRSIEHLQEIDILARCILDIQKLGREPTAQGRVLRYLNDLFGEAPNQR